MTYTETRDTLIEAQSIRFKLRDAIRDFDDMDCVDAMKDARLLLDLMEIRCYEQGLSKTISANAKRLIEQPRSPRA